LTPLPQDPLVARLWPEVAWLIQRFPSGALVACSGGGDSCALLDLMAQWALKGQWPWAVATFDHGLRPEAAVEARWVATQCNTYGVDHFLLHPPTPLHDLPGNLADNARRLRYEALGRCARDLGFSVVLTAHHLDDRIEGMLMALLRGGSPQALAPQPPLRPLEGDLWLARPLNNVGRGELRAYLGGRHLPWLEDPSNSSTHTGRGSARHRLLPWLEHNQPGAREGLAASLSMLSQQLQRDERAALPQTRWHWWRRDPALSPRQAMAGLGLGVALSGREEREILTRWTRSEGRWDKPGLTLLWHGNWAGWGRGGLQPWQEGVWKGDQSVFVLGDWGYLWRDGGAGLAAPPHPYWGRLIWLAATTWQVKVAPPQHPWPAGRSKVVARHLQGGLLPRWLRAPFPALGSMEGAILALPGIASARHEGQGVRVGWCPPWWRLGRR